MYPRPKGSKRAAEGTHLPELTLHAPAGLHGAHASFLVLDCVFTACMSAASGAT